MRLALRLVYLLFALLLLVQIVTVSAQESGYSYTVQPGDSWPLVARRVGLTVYELQEANPEAIRPNGWLIVGERLFIPRVPDGEETFYIVQRGDGWAAVAAKFNVSVVRLQSDNPRALRDDNSLIVGERLLIPSLLPTPESAPTATVAESSAAAAFDILAILSESEESASFFAPNITVPLPTPITLPPCPDAPVNLARSLPALFSIPTSSRYAQLTEFLGDCGAELRIMVSADLNSDNVDDAVLVYDSSGGAQNQTGASPTTGSAGIAGPPGNSQELVILSGGDAHALSYATTATGKVELLATQDINTDGLNDVVWSDTVCGSNICFVTVNVRSWDGMAWQDWTKGTITMAEATVSLNPAVQPGSAMEIRLTGGEYPGDDAGPQRQRTAVWTSNNGAPYALIGERLTPSSCLYHTILDANHAFAVERYLAKAHWLYSDAVENETLQPCGKQPNELAELRSFSVFRLALIAAYLSDPELAVAHVQHLLADYGEQIYSDVARRWLAAYQQSGDPQTACKAVTLYIALSPEPVDLLADYGYANPTFSAQDVCPVLDIEPPPGPHPRLAHVEGLPACPTAAPDFGAVLPQVVNKLAANNLSAPDSASEQQEAEELNLKILIEAWLQSCDAIADERGGLLSYDLNGDGLNDFVALPTIISADGYGPDGADGTALVLHRQIDGSFQAAYTPSVRGEPKILGIGDANEDGKADLFWQMERCETYCLLRVHAISWDTEANAYRNLIASSASIAEGAAYVEMTPQESSTLPRINRLWLSGGVSGTERQGLDIPHTEIWYSVDGLPLRRFTWSYDRANEASNCAGMRLVEANAALHTAGSGNNASGYAKAISLYRNILESTDLRPCSVQGTDPEEELALLHGLARFRLVQVLTLNGQRTQAESLLESLEEIEPQNRYTEAGRTWLNAYNSVPDPVAACASVMSIFLDSPALWQITHEYGHDHPSLTVREVCFVPSSGEGLEFQLTPNW